MKALFLLLLYLIGHSNSFVRLEGKFKSSKLSLVDEFSLSDWGLFQSAQLDLRGQPSFMVITGETGAGKSVFIGGLEYVCTGEGIRKQLFLPSGRGEARLRLRSKKEFKRSYSSSTRRSTCEIDGCRSTAKALGEALAPSVRFWSSQSIDLLRPGSSGYYVDNLLSASGCTTKQELAGVFRDWSLVSGELMRLQELQSRLDEGNEMELLTFYLSETSDLQENMERCLLDMQTIAGELEEAAILGNTVDADSDAGAGGGSPLQQLSTALDVVLGPAAPVPPMGRLQDMSAAWDALKIGEELLKGLAEAVADASVGVGSGGGNSRQSAGAVMGDFLEVGILMDQALDAGVDEGDATAGAHDRLDAVQRQLRMLSDDTSRMQSDFFDMGFGGSRLNDVLERVQVAVQEAGESLAAASEAMEGLRRAVPNLGPVLERLDVVRDEWEGIARKHSCRPEALGALVERWRSDLDGMANMVTALPRAEKDEIRLRMEYIALAGQLSCERDVAARKLQEAVAGLLPQIEMADKLVEVEVRSQVRPLDGSPVSPTAIIRPGVLGVAVDGWDEVHLVIRTTTSGQVRSPRASAVQTEGGDSAAVLAATGDLSSGEAARLALALEASSHNCGAPRLAMEQGREEEEQMQEQPLVIYDEIDAHVGGEAAAAVARLLKRIGTYRQVMAVTHSPVVAAAADRHFVVTKTKGGAASLSTTSTIGEVDGAARRAEIARMATGRLDTDAGEQLAEKLLEIDFGTGRGSETT